MIMIHDLAKCLFLTSSITLFSQMPEIFELPLEKLGFGAILFFIIWTYLKTILPKTHEEMERKNKRIEQLVIEIGKLSDQRERDQRIIEDYIRNDNQELPRSGVHFVSAQNSMEP